MFSALSPKLLSVAALAVILASLTRAFLGRPPASRRIPLAPLALGAGVLLVAAFVVGANFAHFEAAMGLALAGVELSCLAGWVSRADDGGGGGWDDEDEEPPPPSPLDWELFERELRERAERPPALVAPGRG